MHTKEHDWRARIQNRAGTAAVAPAFFYAFANVEENVRHQLQKLRTHPWVPKEVAVRGFVYDVGSGRLREITLCGGAVKTPMRSGTSGPLTLKGSESLV